MNFFNTVWISFKSTVRGFDSPRQLAIGIAFGMVIGLIPKDSLLPYVIGVFALLTTANILCIAVSAVAVSFISPWLDPVSHPIGVWVLTFDPLETIWTSLAQLPIVPWARFENTVVTGSLCLGLMAAIPVYAISLYCFKKFGSSVYTFVVNTRSAQWLIGNPASLQKS